MSARPKIPQAEYRRLGNSGLRVSVPILGCMSFGSKKAMPFALEEEDVSSLRVLLRLIRCLMAFCRRFPY
jgi:aryl-alcohol dehydrogenase-like predicted oxidoreductase